MTRADAIGELQAGQRAIRNIDELLKFIEVAAEVQADSTTHQDLDWWALVEIVRQQLAPICPRLEKVESFLHRQAA